MQRLSPSDALFLYQERSRNDYMHSMRVAVVAMNGRSSQELRDVMARTYSSLEPYHWKVEPVPLGLHHPLWRVDPDFDVDLHMHRVGCPSPGTGRELAELVGLLASSPLDRSRPLWECWIVEGLEGDRAAVVTKVHHALADGVATGYMSQEVCEVEPIALGDLPPPPDFPVEAGASVGAHLRLAARDARRHLVLSVPTLLARQRSARRARVDSAPAASFAESPSTSLNRAPGPHRSYAFTSFELDEIKGLRPRYDATLNDLFLAVIAGGMRRFLLERGELPDVPLIGCMPVSTRQPEEVMSSGNRLGTLAVRLRSDISDPRERTEASKAEADTAKAAFRASAGARPENYVDCLPPAAQHLLLRAVRDQAGRGRPVVGNVGVSNVPGPPDTLYLADFEITSLLGVGPLSGGIGLNITAWSYAGQLNVSVLASREAVPDLWPFIGHIRAAFEELRDL